MILFVHGLWMHGVVFSAHRRELRRMGRESRVFSWHSLLGSLDGAADDLAAHIAALGRRPLHLVGHSLGGCVVLNMLARHHPEGIGRVVLLGSPCCGSHAGDKQAYISENTLGGTY
ncbi:MAG TPA: alpha/beta hydrolase, partial [Thauera aminoaromatica]|nr:alpha/beta hydrolase [Thauera aminoaromatica]